MLKDLVQEPQHVITGHIPAKEIIWRRLFLSHEMGNCPWQPHAGKKKPAWNNSLILYFVHSCLFSRVWLLRQLSKRISGSFWNGALLKQFSELNPFLHGSSQKVLLLVFFHKDMWEVLWKCRITQAPVSCFSSLPYHSCAQLRLFEKQQPGKKTMPFPPLLFVINKPTQHFQIEPLPQCF